jgi:putative ABC transport system permease protein
MIRTQKGLGDNIVIAWPARTSKPWQGLPRGRIVNVSEEDVALIRSEVPAIRSISGEYGSNSQKVKLGRNVMVPQLVGSDVGFAVMRNLIPQAGGRYINELDLERRRRVIFLGDQLKKDLFGDEEAVGRQVSVGGLPFKVVGVMQPKGQDSSYQGRDKDSASIPASTLRTMLGKPYVDNLIFQAADPARTEEAKDKLIAVLARKHRFDPEDKEAVVMWDTTEGFRFMNVFFIAFRAFLGIVGALTLVVGGIGVSNIMNVVVEERTKEIGIKMALGARRRYVIGQFLFETLVLTLGGGLIGFGISWGVCAAFPALGAEEFVGTPQISAGVAAITTLILGSIGFLAGYFPARTAAALDPVVAMRM